MRKSLCDSPPAKIPEKSEGVCDIFYHNFITEGFNFKILDKIDKERSI
jgi:hypothetical protein